MTTEDGDGRAARARRLQEVIDSVVAASEGQPVDRAVELLQRKLAQAGLHAPTTAWLEAVARDAAAGRTYVVATDAELHELDASPGRDRLESAPAHLAVRAAPSDASPAPPTAPALPGADTARPEGHGPTIGRHRWLLVAVVMVAVLLLRRRRHGTRPGGADPAERG